MSMSNSKREELIQTFVNRLSTQAANTLTATGFEFNDIADDDVVEALAEGVIESMYSPEGKNIGHLEVLSMEHQGIFALTDLETARVFSEEVFGLKQFRRFVPPGTTMWCK